MGRKIPSKKHRGVKDPLQQQAKRLQSLKGKINAPPKDPDEQPVPRSLTRLFGLQDPSSDNKTKKPFKKNHKQARFNDSRQNNSQSGKNPISQMKKLPGESGRSFSLRINSAIKALHGSINQEDYPVEMETEADDTKGERMEAQRRRRERKRKQKGAGEGEPAPTRTQRLALKKQAKKQRETEAAQEKREVVYERVGFGEVAHAPPALAFKHKKAAKEAGAPRPGRRDLLLNKLLGSSDGQAAAATAATAKRPRQRELPAAERLRRERARQDAVDAYRKIKAKAQQTQNKTQ